MCGIFFRIGGGGGGGDAVDLDNVMRLKARGPDSTVIQMHEADSVTMAFFRLMINDLSVKGNQPMYKDGVYLLCNGEIYNAEQLKKGHNLTCTSTSDCEVVLQLYVGWKNGWRQGNIMEELMLALDGEFAMVLYDSRRKTVMVARDPYGVRPLFYNMNNEKGQLTVCSELKAMGSDSGLVPFPPGSYQQFEINNSHVRTGNHELMCYVERPRTAWLGPNVSVLRGLFIEAVKKRLMSDRPICALLSGGLDSSLVVAVASRLMWPKRLKTFCIGFCDSTDCYYAEKVAKACDTDHKSIYLVEADFLAAIEETIRVIESYDITSVRASVGNLLVAKYIRENTDCKVVLNGDYSDEVCGGYLYMRKAPTPEAFDAECKRLVRDIYAFDSLRSDRTISSQGLEARVPFADRAFVECYHSFPAEERWSHGDRIEKRLLREAGEGLLPEEVLWRKKEAFSDGVSSPERSWHRVLAEHIETLVSDAEFEEGRKRMVHNPPPTKEAYYYRKVFERHYGAEAAGVIPYFWMPRWSEGVTDPSARELSC